jgi:hypothetical protein
LSRGFLASLARLELATYCLEGSCSILLSYRDRKIMRSPTQNRKGEGE